MRDHTSHTIKKADSSELSCKPIFYSCGLCRDTRLCGHTVKCWPCMGTKWCTHEIPGSVVSFRVDQCWGGPGNNLGLLKAGMEARAENINTVFAAGNGCSCDLTSPKPGWSTWAEKRRTRSSFGESSQCLGFKILLVTDSNFY